MEHLFILNACRIKVLFREHSVHIVNDLQLWQGIGAEPAASTGKLVQLIFETFRNIYGREFAVHPDSLIVEIWGHVYCEYFALVIEKLAALKLIERIADKVIGYCELIDCGEEGFDHNRSLWDILAPFTSLIGGWLPENIAEKNVKE